MEAKVSQLETRILFLEKEASDSALVLEQEKARLREGVREKRGR